ncbi:Coiled-coil domain-containing protein [Intoshia linei]|uniref:Coiled-coil domain-containing protein n=1 Tax=Intoshia linei TaxID=1819745 RepID=A0A177AZV1_9BILA|nr:Coiled-coil domain-containing protein [Intoshia linei]
MECPLSESESEDSERQMDGELKRESFILEPIIPDNSELTNENRDIITEVSSSSILQMLDQLSINGKLNTIDVSFLKSKYSNMHDNLKKISILEAEYIHDRKTKADILEFYKSRISDIESFTPTKKIQDKNSDVSDEESVAQQLSQPITNIEVESSNEMLNLRKQLLSTNNELSQIEDRQYQILYKINHLEEEKSILEKELKRLPTIETINDKNEILNNEITKKRREIGQFTQEIQMLNTEIEKCNESVKENDKLIAKSCDKLEKLKGDLVSVSSLPSQISKEIERYSKQKVDVLRKSEMYQQEVDDINTTLSKYDQQVMTKYDEINSIKSELSRINEEMSESERLISAFTTDLNMSREKEVVLLGDRANMDINLKYLNIDKRTENELQNRHLKDKERELRNLKKSEVQHKFCLDQLKSLKNAFDRVNETNNLVSQPNQLLLRRRFDVKHEVDTLKRALSQQNSLTNIESLKVDNFINEEESLLMEQSDLRIEVIELSRLAIIKVNYWNYCLSSIGNDEREQKSKDYQKSEQRFTKIMDDLKQKELIIKEMKKKYVLLHERLEDFAKIYYLIKNERNKCVTSIQISLQKNSELSEKIKIFHNEIEILRNNSNKKENGLHKKRMKISSDILIRDNVQMDLSKNLSLEDKLIEEREQQRLKISRLNQMINLSEEYMINQRKIYDQATKIRNDRGIELVKLNADVCLFYQKFNTQEETIKHSEIEYKLRLDDINNINLELNEQKRNCENLKKLVPKINDYKNELLVLNQQIDICKQRKIELEKRTENPKTENRTRYLDNPEQSYCTLSNKLFTLEKQLGNTEEKLLEKELISRQVNRLIHEIKTDINNRRNETFEIGNKINEIQRSIKTKTKNIKALIAEISLNQAKKFKHIKIKEEAEENIKNIYDNMDNGKYPSKKIEQNWNRYCENNKRIQIDKEVMEKTDEWKNQHRLLNGGFTMADPRPNAYIPENDSQLPIPKPYGVHAPFKPSEHGANMRHIRNPTIKDIEI